MEKYLTRQKKNVKFNKKKNFIFKTGKSKNSRATIDCILIDEVS